MNKCKLVGKGDARSLISGASITGLAVGQQEDFVFVLNVPEDFAEDRVLEISVKCEETEATESFDVSLSKDVVEVQLLSTEHKNDVFSFSYLVREKAGKNQEVHAGFWLENMEGLKVAEGEDSFSLTAGQELMRQGSMSLVEKVGEFVFNLELEVENSVIRSEEPILLGKLTGLIGRDLFVSGSGKIISIAVFIFASAFIVIYVIRRFLRKKSREKERGYIKVK